MKDVEEIYQSLLNRYTERTGEVLAEDCDLAVRLWAVSAQIQSLYIQTEWVLNQSFPQTAQDTYLEYHAAMRGLHRNEATKAVGELTFYVTALQKEPITIPKGTVCMTDGELRYQTVEDAVLEAETAFVTVAAEAVEAGRSGNVPAGAVRLLTVCPLAVTSVRNRAAFLGGADVETDDALRKRILSSYQRLPNGANAMWYEETALSCPGVAAAKAIGRARGIGTVDVYISAPEGIPDENLIETVRKELQERREIAVDVQVKAPTQKIVNVAVALKIHEDADAETVIENAQKVIADYFSGKLLGKSVLLADLGSRLFAIDGVENYRFAAPAADLNADDTDLAVLGSVTVAEWETD